MNDADKTKQQLIDELTELRQRVAKLDHAEAMRQQTQESYQVLVDHSLQGMAIYQGGRFVVCNARLAEILGRSIDALSTLRFDNGDLAELVYPDDQAHIQCYLRDRAAGRPVPSYYDLRVVHPDDEVRWVEAHTVAIEYAGQPAVQVVVIDITEREQMAQALRESQTILTEAQRIAHIGNWVFYLDSGELYWSPELHRIFGRDRQELDPDQNFLWIHPDDRERVRDAAATYLREKGRMDIEYRILRVDG